MIGSHIVSTEVMFGRSFEPLNFLDGCDSEVEC